MVSFKFCRWNFCYFQLFHMTISCSLAFTLIWIAFVWMFAVKNQFITLDLHLKAGILIKSPMSLTQISTFNSHRARCSFNWIAWRMAIRRKDKKIHDFWSNDPQKYVLKRGIDKGKPLEIEIIINVKSIIRSLSLFLMHALWLPSIAVYVVLKWNEYD